MQRFVPGSHLISRLSMKLKLKSGETLVDILEINIFVNKMDSIC